MYAANSSFHAFPLLLRGKHASCIADDWDNAKMGETGEFVAVRGRCVEESMMGIRKLRSERAFDKSECCRGVYLRYPNPVMDYVAYALIRLLAGICAKSANSIFWLDRCLLYSISANVKIQTVCNIVAVAKYL